MKRGEGEKKKKRKRKRRREEKKRGEESKVWNFGFLYGTTKFDYGSLVCMIIILPKPRVLLGFHLNPKFMESKVGKTLYDTRWL